MKPNEILQAAYNKLADEYDEDPRSELMRNLARLTDAEEEVPSGLLELSASVAPGGAFVVRDQHGREVAGVKSVAVFTDQSGAPVFQVNL